MTRRSYPIVAVRWTDACSYDGWRDADDPMSVKHTLTMGALIENTPDHVSVAGSLTDDGEIACTMVIPRAMVEEVRSLVNGKRIKAPKHS